MSVFEYYKLCMQISLCESFTYVCMAAAAQEGFRESVSVHLDLHKGTP